MSIISSRSEQSIYLTTKLKIIIISFPSLVDFNDGIVVDECNDEVIS